VRLDLHGETITLITLFTRLNALILQKIHRLLYAIIHFVHVLCILEIFQKMLTMYIWGI